MHQQKLLWTDEKRQFEKLPLQNDVSDRLGNQTQKNAITATTPFEENVI